MKTWISILLPDDEYKEKKIMAFLAEGSIILLITLIGMTFLNQFLNIDAETVLLISIGVFVLYVSGRYITSGIEYTDVASDKAYKKERKLILIRTFSFTTIFIVLYIPLVHFPSSRGEWMEILGLLTTAALFMFLSSYISLKRSYRKNKELL
ncbi:DUF3278 domain-containing protein [Jeotgalibacillus haloalkalitolerans]|uniref:DUF3278 domain-containing protein n=1 Tax=Jeotgalibacillus haloalkalitolerans TaxID=3104292 RepID=A0ABU5KHR7_9BACL|nr:DUF3278 domain-containing protein [Jeotgalibacillus sp. HH7-29]MDZ5710767.1 DUF3278 domain-containing protein [Jeotgalibacillus sp. HH7-29]